MTKLEQIEEEIKLLQKEKEKELLRIEVEKLKKTVIEETVIKRKVVEEWPYYPIAIWNGTGTTNNY